MNPRPTAYKAAALPLSYQGTHHVNPETPNKFLSSAVIGKGKGRSRVTSKHSMNKHTGRIFIVLLLAYTLYPPTAAGGQPPEAAVNVVEIGGVEAALVNSSLYSADAAEEIRTLIETGAPVVLYGDRPEQLLDVYMPRIYVEGASSEGSRLVALGVIAASGNRSGDLVLRVMGRMFTEDMLEHAVSWVEDCRGEAEGSPSDGYERVGLIREVERHEPYGVVESTVELVRVLGDDSETYDWYDVTVTQTVSPGRHTGDSGWGWGWLEYRMNGSTDGANVYLSDYDAPPSGEPPIGLFSFLWRIMTFRWDEAFPWLREEPVVQGLDMSDFSQELFMARYENMGDAGTQFTVRHRYVLSVGEGKSPMFWHQTQVKYVKGAAFNVERHITPPILEGLVTVNP